jgi:hypothetical protein
MKKLLAVCLLGVALQTARCQEGWTNGPVISGTELQRLNSGFWLILYYFFVIASQ